MTDGTFRDARLLKSFGALLTAMEIDLTKQGLTARRAKILVGSLLLTTGQSALIQATQMPELDLSGQMPDKKQ